MREQYECKYCGEKIEYAVRDCNFFHVTGVKYGNGYHCDKTRLTSAKPKPLGRYDIIIMKNNDRLLKIEGIELQPDDKLILANDSMYKNDENLDTAFRADYDYVHHQKKITDV